MATKVRTIVEMELGEAAKYIESGKAGNVRILIHARNRLAPLKETIPKAPNIQIDLIRSSENGEEREGIEVSDRSDETPAQFEIAVYFFSRTVSAIFCSP